MTDPSPLPRMTAEKQSDGACISDLIARLERATAPDRELDARIWCSWACDHEFIRFERWNEHSGRLCYRIKGIKPEFESSGFPLYTASIDAALTLLPQEWWGLIEWAGTSKPNDRLWPVVKIGSGDRRFKVQGRTTPLSVCIAALKSRVSQ